MIYIFHVGIQLTIFSLAWIATNILFKGNRVIPIVIFIVGALSIVISVFSMGWLS